MPAWMVLVFCFAAECQTVYPEIAVSSTACPIAVQEYAAQWVGDHPNWQLDHFRCVMGNKPGPITDGNW